MALQINWTTLALSDISNIANFIAKDSLHYSAIQTERFFERVKILETHSEIGTIAPELGTKSIRQLVEGRYRIIYRIVNPTRIDILTIYHKSRLLSDNTLI